MRVDEKAVARLRDEPVDWRFKGMPSSTWGSTVEQVVAGRPGLFAAGFSGPLVVLDRRRSSTIVTTMADWCRSSRSPARAARQDHHGPAAVRPAARRRRLGHHPRQPRRSCGWPAPSGSPACCWPTSSLDPAGLALAGRRAGPATRTSRSAAGSTPCAAVALMDAALRSAARPPGGRLVELGAPGGRTGARDDATADGVAAAVAAARAAARRRGRLRGRARPRRLGRGPGHGRRLPAPAASRSPSAGRRTLRRTDEIVVTAGGSAVLRPGGRGARSALGRQPGAGRRTQRRLHHPRRRLLPRRSPRSPEPAPAAPRLRPALHGLGAGRRPSPSRGSRC